MTLGIEMNGIIYWAEHARWLVAGRFQWFVTNLRVYVRTFEMLYGQSFNIFVYKPSNLYLNVL